MPVTRARAADDAEGDVGAEAGCGLEVTEAGPAQHGGGVGGPAAEAGAGGDALLEPHVGRAARARAEGPAHQVVVGGLDSEAGAGGGVDQLEAVAQPDDEGVGQVEGDHLGVDEVVPVIAHTDGMPGAHCPEGPPLHHPPTITSMRWMAGTSSSSCNTMVVPTLYREVGHEGPAVGGQQLGPVDLQGVTLHQPPRR